MYCRSVLRLVTCIALLLATFANAKNVLVVDSYHAEYPWTAKERQGFNQTIDSKHTVTYMEMDTKRIPEKRFAERAERIWKQILIRKPDIVVTMDDNALKHLGQRVADAGYYLVFMGVNNDPRAYFRDGRIPDNVGGVLERPLVRQNITMISMLIPTKNKRIILLMDNGITSRSFVEYSLDSSYRVISEGITMEVETLGQFPEWQRKVRAATPDTYDAIIIGSYAAIKDDRGNQVSDRYVAEWTSANASIPVFTFWSHGAGKGKSLGGLSISGVEQGASAAKAVNAILETGKVPYPEAPKHGELVFSKSELKRWGIELPRHIQKRTIFID